MFESRLLLKHITRTESWEMSVFKESGNKVDTYGISHEEAIWDS